MRLSVRCGRLYIFSSDFFSNFMCHNVEIGFPVNIEMWYDGQRFHKAINILLWLMTVGMGGQGSTFFRTITVCTL